MRRFAASVRRILLAVIVVISLLAAILVGAIRQPNFGRRAFAGTDHADAGALRRHVEFLAGSESTRDWRNASGLDRAAGYVAEGFRRARARCAEQPYEIPGLRTKNVVATFGPDRGPRVVVGAHYDACGPLPGADDNASGVAGLLELARLLDGVRLSRPVELVAYSTEEPPWFGGPEMGSAVHANEIANSHTEVRAMISLEMIGYFTDVQPGHGSLLASLYPRDGRFIACVGRWADRGLVREAKKSFRGATQVSVVSYSGPVAPGIDLSDHRNYWAVGIPAIMVTDTGPLRNLNYHRATDTADSLDYTRMAGVVDGVFSFVVHLSNDD